ncbi:hypothetical protein PV326_007445, partial [Microctonus aethiopoides]
MPLLTFLCSVDVIAPPSQAAVTRTIEEKVPARNTEENSMRKIRHSDFSPSLLLVYLRPKFIEPPVLRRLKVMKGHNMKKPIKKPSNATATREINTHYSYYDWHYNQPFYVDKTLLIKKLLKVNHVMISAPSGFGKTLNMDMVRRFLEIEVDEDGKAIKLDVDEDKGCLKSVQTKSKNFKLFEGKKILEDEKFVFKHFGKYPTVHVDFSELVGNDYEEILVKFRKILNKAFRQHAYLEKCS